jgi:hypothetical protein
MVRAPVSKFDCGHLGSSWGVLKLPRWWEYPERQSLLIRFRNGLSQRVG